MIKVLERLNLSTDSFHGSIGEADGRNWKISGILGESQNKRLFLEIREMGRSFENRKHSILKTAGQKSKIYSKYGKQLYVAAKNGVPDPEANPTLRILIERAKKDQVPAHVIDKAIEKAKGVGGEDYSDARYEGFGPGSCMVIVECLTDNNNRDDYRRKKLFYKNRFQTGEPGTVAHLFDQLAVLSFSGEDEESVLDALMEGDVEVDDVERKDGQITVFTPPSEFFKAKQALSAAFPEIEFEVQEITFLPQATTEISADDLPAFEKFINLLNDCEDVQEIYHNAILPTAD